MRRRSIVTVFGLLAGSLAAGLATGAPVAQAAGVPAGFTDEFVGSFSSPTAVEWLPGNRIVVLEQAGRIRVSRPGGTFTTAIDLDVCAQFEKGLLGLAPDPGFLGNKFVYVYYTRPDATAPGGCVNRVSRFQMSNDTIDPASELVLLDRISAVNGNHNGGDLDVGSDGFLYVGVGDAGANPRGGGSGGANFAAQDLSLLNGKILRITLTGEPAPGNPLTGPGTARCAFRGNTALTPSTACQEIFAWGLRNPFRFAFDRNDGSDRFFINDVGQNTQEEVNLGAVGANYGWPTREGSCAQGFVPPCPGPPAGLTDPITSYAHTLGTYITGGAFVPDGLWPDAYDDAYLFADGGSGRIWARYGSAPVDYGTPFATGAFGIRDMAFGFDDEGTMVLYYVQGSSLRAIVPPPAQAAPALQGHTIIPVTPFRAYDTGRAIGVAAGAAFNGTTRRVDLDPPGDYEAALVNLTYDRTAGPGFLRIWGTRSPRPETSSLNAGPPGSAVANAAIVPLDADGAFILESAATGRIIVDVMAWLDATTTSDDGRFVDVPPGRLVNTRVPAGTTLDSGSSNPWQRTGTRIDIDAEGEIGIPDDGTVGGLVLSVVAIGEPGLTGWAGGFPGGETWPGTSNVNVARDNRRANFVLIPADGTGVYSFETRNIADLVVDLVGYITSDTADTSTSGLYWPAEPSRIVDTRDPVGFSTLAPLVTDDIGVPSVVPAAAVVQNLTLVRATGPGWLAAHPTDVLPVISNLNATQPGQTRAVLAFTRLGPDGRERFTAQKTSDLVVDVLGTFAE